MEVRFRDLDEAKVALLGTVTGLVREADRVREAVRELAPERIAVGISPGELATLQRLAADDVEADVEVPISDADEAYAQHLSRFGKVRLPPPSYQRAVELAGDRDLPITALDLDEDAYTDAYTDHVGAIDLIRKGRRERKLAKRGVEAETAVEFARAWDATLLKIGGLREVEELREAHMAEQVRRLCREATRILVVVDAARLDGIEALLWPEDAKEGGSGLLPWS